MTLGFQAPTCDQCGHTAGCHASGGGGLAGFMRRTLIAGGRCLRDDCDCTEFVPACVEPETEEAA